MKKKLLVVFMIVLFLLVTPLTTSGRMDTKAIFDDVSKMTSEEIVAEMKYAASTGAAGKYFPQDRIHALEMQMAKNQTAEIERFKAQLKKDAEVAKKVEELKQKAIDKAKEKGNEYYEENKDRIQQEVEDQTRRMLGMSETDWIVKKEEFTDMYTNGSKAYEEHVEKYVEVAQKAYEAYNAYNQAKADHPEAPESAQNLLGFLNATKVALDFAGDKMEKTPLRPIGEILKLYGAATGLGDTAAKNAWQYIHREGINPNVQSQYSEGLKKVGLDIFDYSGIEKSNIMMFDKNIRILRLASGEYAVFNDKFEIVPGSTGNTLTAAEYEKLEQMYVAFSNGKKDGWPDLNAEQLAKLARGEKVQVTVDDNIWPFSDEVKEFTSETVMAMGESHASRTINDDIFTSLDRIINGEQGVLDKMFDPFTKGGRISEIRDLYKEFVKNNEGYTSIIHDKEAFLEWVKEIKEANKDLTPEELKAKIKELLGMDKDGKTEDEETDEDEEPGEDANPLLDKLEEIDPLVKDADASGITSGDSASTGGDHWTQQTPEDFNGEKDGGFANTGGTNRPMPGGSNPQNIGIPVFKPNIYLYPETTSDIALTFKQPLQLTTVIPEYENYWKVTVEPDGLIDKQYGFLFYEAIVQKVFFQTSVGWILPVDQRESAFDEMLTRYKFNQQEKNDFIEFWNEKLDSTIEYEIYPQETDIIDRVMPLVVEPKPSKSYRIWFYFIPGEGKNMNEPDQVETILREGYVLVEWGGMYK